MFHSTVFLGLNLEEKRRTTQDIYKDAQLKNKSIVPVSRCPFIWRMG